jgi:hypothetical protein
MRMLSTDRSSLIGVPFRSVSIMSGRQGHARKVAGSCKVTNGDYDETKEVLTGFCFIEAKDMNHAVEPATGSPWLLHDRTEIFEVEIGRSK